MRLVTFRPAGTTEQRLGALREAEVVDLTAMSDGAPELASMTALFEAGEDGMRHADRLFQNAGRDSGSRSGQPVIRPRSEVQLLAPVPRPRRIRDYLTYEQHAAGVGAAVPEAFAQMPICYQCNTDSVIGPEQEITWPPYTDQLDFELEIGFFVGRGGRNITVADAPRHIAGVTIFNDVSARDIQFLEMSMGIGPSKGKDFCNVLGPAVLTMDEIEDENAIELTVSVNDEVWARGTTAHRRYSFAEVLAWASYGEDVHPGEFLAVGTVGGGCGAELNRWIRPGDTVELEASGVGVLRNRVGSPEQAPADAGLTSYQGAPRFRPPSAQ